MIYEDSNRLFDVVIVGAGPAGSSCAIRLALAGLRVLLVEKHKFPREKLCGEFISPECLRHFWELGITPQAMVSAGADIVETVFYSKRGKGVSFKSKWFGLDDQSALGLSRARMDNVLMVRAKEVGVEVREETSVGEFVFDVNEVWKIELKRDGQTSQVNSRLLIDATGRTRILGRRFEKTARKAPAKFVAFKTHLEGAQLAANACEIYSYNGGYGGCSQVEDGLLNICFIAETEIVKQFGGDGGLLMREVVCRNRRAAHALRDAEPVKPWLAVPISKFGRAELVPANGLLTIGDAAAFIDPFTGSGILLALESARIASKAIIEGFTDRFDREKIAADYQANYLKAFERRLRICSLLRNAAFSPSIAEPAISLLNISGQFRRFIARSTRG